MKKYLKWAFLALFFLVISCDKGEKLPPDELQPDEKPLADTEVYGYLAQPESDDPGTDAKSDIKLSFKLGDNINIWSNTGAMVIYSARELTDGGGARFEGDGFSLGDGETYYSSYPQISSLNDNLHSLTTSYEGQVQTADGDCNHVAGYSYACASSLCTGGKASFAYHYVCRWLRFQLTLPGEVNVTELTVTADSQVFALDGTVDVTTGSFTPGKMSDNMTLKLNNVKVTDGVLNAFLAHAPYGACNIVVTVKDKDGKVYSSPEVSQADASAVGKYRTITQTLTEDSAAADGVARIGLVTYPTLEEAIAAVPNDGTPTTITMIGDESITGHIGILIDSDQNVILDLNGHTIAQTGPMVDDSYLIRLYGSLTVKDSSDSARDGSGTGKITVNSGTSSHDSFMFNNLGVLNIESGYFEMNGSSASRVVFNVSRSKTTITGGKLKNSADNSYVVEMYLTSTTYNNILNISGTAVLEAPLGIWICYGTNNADKGEVNISGGTFNTVGRALYSSGWGSATALNASGLSLDISGGTFGGQGIALNAFTPFKSISVSGGSFYEFISTLQSGTKFMTGGELISVENFFNFRLPSQTMIADGYKIVHDGNYFVVPNSDPRPAVQVYPPNKVSYYWEGSNPQVVDFYRPFEGPDPIMEAGEFICLIEDITLTKDVSYIEESSWCTPIFQGGTFYLEFGEFDIKLNGYAFALPTGVSVKTDRKTDIFTALSPGRTVVETLISEGKYHYKYSCQ